MVLPLTCIHQNQSAVVVWLALSPSLERRLTDLGFAPGETVVCVIKGRKNGMSAYLADNAVIALRKEDAAGIFVKPLSQDSAP